MSSDTEPAPTGTLIAGADWKTRCAGFSERGQGSDRACKVLVRHNWSFKGREKNRRNSRSECRKPYQSAFKKRCADEWLGSLDISTTRCMEPSHEKRVPESFQWAILPGMHLFWSMRIWVRRDFAYRADINRNGQGLKTTRSEGAVWKLLSSQPAMWRTHMHARACTHTHTHTHTRTHTHTHTHTHKHTHTDLFVCVQLVNVFPLKYISRRAFSWVWGPSQVNNKH